MRTLSIEKIISLLKMTLSFIFLIVTPCLSSPYLRAGVSQAVCLFFAASFMEEIFSLRNLFKEVDKKQTKKRTLIVLFGFIFLIIYIFIFDFVLRNEIIIFFLFFIFALEIYKMLYRFKLKATDWRVILFSITVLLISCLLLSNIADSNEKHKKQWYLESQYDVEHFAPEGVGLDAEYMWNIMDYYRKTAGMPKKEVIVAMVDIGVNDGHSALKNTLWTTPKEVCFDENDDFREQENETNYKSKKENGTICAGIIGGKGKITGVVGNHPVRLMSLDVSNHNEIQETDIKRVIKAIQYAEENGAQICTLNLSVEKEDKALREVMESSNMLFVVPTGDQDSEGLDLNENPRYPAAYGLSNMIAVANLSYEGALNKASNYGDGFVDLAAPGTCIYSTSADGDYAYSNGSSASSSIVAGVAALTYLIMEEPDASQVKAFICANTVKLETLTKKVSTGGYINGAKVIDAVIRAEQLQNRQEDAKEGALAARFPSASVRWMTGCVPIVDERGTNHGKTDEEA